jgi:hypothetical protein
MAAAFIADSYKANIATFLSDRIVGWEQPQALLWAPLETLTGEDLDCLGAAIEHLGGCNFCVNPG